jgi:hypothetical protein
MAMPSLPNAIAALLGAVLLTACSSEPTFNRRADNTIVCHIKEGGQLTEVKIAFLNQGRQALIDWGERSALVEFDRNILLTDYYSGDGMTLSIDPEVRVADLARDIGGLCQ